jgi:hypothetical protein
MGRSGTTAGGLTNATESEYIDSIRFIPFFFNNVTFFLFTEKQM